MKVFLVLILFFFVKIGLAQTDSVVILNETIVRGFESNRELLTTAAAISSIKTQEIARFDNLSFIQLLNSQTGIRMEERSPGSYRISIRGSSLRSPFGVRNVKIYWNAIPLTDASGSTYFNQVDINSMGSFEILRGPSGSLFGAGIGGVINMQTKSAQSGHKLQSEVSVGDFNTQNYGLAYTFGSSKNNTTIKYTDNHTDGYRNHTRFDRNSLNLSSTFFVNPRHSINLFSFLSFINYQTPGALNLEQLKANRKASRPKNAFTESTQDQNTGIDQQIVFIGFSDVFQTKNNWKITTSAFFSDSKLTNPALTNYEERPENSLGGRLLITKRANFLNTNISFGTEGVYSSSDFFVSKNLKGKPTDKLYNEEVKASQLSAFYQLDWQLIKTLYFTLGASHNFQKIDYSRVAIASQFKNTNLVDKPIMPFAPRISLLKSFGDNFTVYGSVGVGFSGPTTGEFVNTIQFAPNFKLLKAEKGTNYEIGSKFRNKNNSVFLELAFYSMKINNGLVRNLTETNTEYFVNSAQILQRGIEFSSRFDLIKPNTNLFLSYLSLKFNYALNDYKYKKFVLNAVDFSNKRLPGIAKNTEIITLDIVQKNGFFTNFDFNFLSSFVLNNANTITAPATIISMGRAGYKYVSKSYELKVFAGIDNIFNKEYSLGYDFNADGNRFFNPAALRNYNGGAQFSIKF